jgi:hypothetical protein
VVDFLIFKQPKAYIIAFPVLLILTLDSNIVEIISRLIDEEQVNRLDRFLFPGS